MVLNCIENLKNCVNTSESSEATAVASAADVILAPNHDNLLQSEPAGKITAEDNETLGSGTMHVFLKIARGPKLHFLR